MWLMILVCTVVVIIVMVIINFFLDKKGLNEKSKKLNKSKLSEQEKQKVISKYENLTHVSDVGYDSESDWEKYYKERDSINIKPIYKESYSVRDSYFRDLFLTSITDKTVILDTETSGLDEKSEIIEISIIDLKGNVLLDTLIKPKRKIPMDAINIHGITNEMVKEAPKWEDIYKDFREIVKSADLVLIYNERYDKRLIMQTCRLAKVPTPKFASDCVMKIMARWNSEKKRNGEYLFKSLEYIAKARGVKGEGTPHRSLTDCKAVRDIINSFIK